MEDNKWYESIEKEINSLKEKMSEEDYNYYGLGLLLQAAKRVDDFSSECEECDSIKEKITSILACISNWPKTTKEEKENYIQVFRSITEHLKKQHNLRQKGWPLWILTIIGGLLGALPGLIGVLSGMQATHPSARAENVGFSLFFCNGGCYNW